jgi:predicted nucleic acid-binding protein
MAVYTVDASVFLNAFNPHEDGHETSRQFLAALRRQAEPIVVPTLLLPEVAAAVRRGRGDSELARRFAQALGRFPHLVLVPLDETLAHQSIETAAEHGLRGSDAVYVAVVLRYSSTLVTLDREQRERASSAVAAYEPQQALAGL